MEMAGYAVVSSKESSVVEDLLRKQAFDGAVICSSIPIDMRVELARYIKKVKPALPIIILYTDGENDRLQGLADELVQSVHGFAEPLIEAITRVIGQPD
jgi:DNA-binding NarL/FixJ family response regulator